MVAGVLAAVAACASTAHGQAALFRTLSVGPVSALAFSPSGDHLAVGGANDTILVVETTGWRIVHTLEGQTGQVNALSWSPNGELLASGSSDSTVRLWDPATGETSAVLAGPTGL